MSAALPNEVRVAVPSRLLRGRCRPVVALVGLPRSQWKLSPDMKLTHHRDPNHSQNKLDGVDHVRDVLRVLPSLCKDS